MSIKIEQAAFYQNLPKRRLVEALQAVGDETYRKSWSKQKLVDHICTHSIDKILAKMDEEQLAGAVKSANFVMFKTIKRSVYNQKKLSTKGTTQQLVASLLAVLDNKPDDSPKEVDVPRRQIVRLNQLLAHNNIENVQAGLDMLDFWANDYPSLKACLHLPDSFASFDDLFAHFGDYPHAATITLHVIQCLQKLQAPWLAARKRRYRILISGYEWEYVQQELTKEQYEFWQQTDISLAAYAHDTLAAGKKDDIPAFARFRTRKHKFAYKPSKYGSGDDEVEWFSLSSLGHESGIHFEDSQRFQVKEIAQKGKGWRNRAEIEIAEVCVLSFAELREKGATFVLPPLKDSNRVHSTPPRYGMEILMVSKGDVATGQFLCSGELDLSKFQLQAYTDTNLSCVARPACPSTSYYDHNKSLSYSDEGESISIETSLKSSTVKFDSADLFLF